MGEWAEYTGQWGLCCMIVCLWCILNLLRNCISTSWFQIVLEGSLSHLHGSVQSSTMLLSQAFKPTNYFRIMTRINDM